MEQCTIAAALVYHAPEGCPPELEAAVRTAVAAKLDELLQVGQTTLTYACVDIRSYTGAFRYGEIFASSGTSYRVSVVYQTAAADVDMRLSFVAAPWRGTFKLCPIYGR